MSISEAELRLSHRPSQRPFRAILRAEANWTYSRVERFRLDFFEDDLDLRFPEPSAKARRSLSRSIALGRESSKSRSGRSAGCSCCCWTRRGLLSEAGASAGEIKC